MVVAGGQGSRLRPLTDGRPKPLLPLGGAPFLVGVLDRLAEAGVTRVFLVVGADTAPFAVLRAPAAARGVTVECVAEPRPLDTAGGVRSVMDRVRRPFYVLNGDVLTDLDLRGMATHHVSSGADVTISLSLVEDTSTFGVCVRAGTRITEFVEKPAPGTLPGQRGVNAGTYLLEPGVLTRFPHGRLSFERQVFPDVLAAGGHVEGFAWDGVWADLGTPERYRRGHRLVLDGAMPWPPVREVPDHGDGVRIADDATIAPSARLLGPVLVGPGASIGPRSRLGPYATVGRGCRIGADVVLRDVVLDEAVVVGDRVRVVGLVAGRGARVRDDADVGRDVVLGDGAEVGGDDVAGDASTAPAAASPPAPA